MDEDFRVIMAYQPPISHLKFPPFTTTDAKNLLDREKELGLLRHEYATMVQRARHARQYHQDGIETAATTSTTTSRNNLTAVLCIAGKAGTGKTALARAFITELMQQQENEEETAATSVTSPSSSHRQPYSPRLQPVFSSSSSTATSNSSNTHTQHHHHHPPEAYFLFGKSHWPTSSVTSVLHSQPDDHLRAAEPYYEGGAGGPQDQQQQRLLPRHHEPLASFAMILNHLTEQITRKPPVVADRIRTRILHAIGNTASVAVLGELSPHLAEFLHQQPSAVTNNATEQRGDSHAPHLVPSSPSSPPTTTTNNPKRLKKITHSNSIPVENRMPRLFYLMRQLFRAICDNRNPCVVVLDDAQWADTESLELARHLHADMHNPWFLLILTWRTNHIHEEEACYTAVGSSIGLFADDLVRRINLQNLSIEATTLMVAQALQMSPSEVTELARVVMTKTLGNPFFVRQLLQHLEQQQGLLIWREGSILAPLSSLSLSWSWSWDAASIARLDSSANFVDLVALQLRRLPLQCCVVAQVLACLGRAFDEEIAAIILDRIETVEMYGCDITATSAMACFDALVQDGFLERHSDSKSGFSLQMTATTSFAHDLIQEAAFQLIPTASRSLLQLRVGERLLEIMEERNPSDDSGSEVNYLGVDLCSKGVAFLSSKERLGLALYNFLAGEKCMALASYTSALAYYEYGLFVLRVGDFLKGSLSVELSVGAMEASFGAADLVKVHLHYDRITGSRSSPEHKIRAHILLIRVLGTRGNVKEAVATGYRVLRSIGIKNIAEMSNKVSLFVQMRKTKMALRKFHSDDEALAHLPDLAKTKVIQAMRIVEVMLPFAYQQDVQLFWLLVLKAVRWSVKYGVSGQSALVFAALGSFPAFQAMDMTLATSLGEASLQLLRRFGTHDYSGMVLFLAYSRILNWTLEPSVIHKHLEMTYRISMEAGDTLSASCSLAAAYTTAYEAGRVSLEDLESQGEKNSLGLKEAKFHSIGTIHNATWQAVLNLRGDSYNSWELTGRAMSQDEALLMANASKNELLEFTILSLQMQLCYFMGEYPRADALRQRSETVLRSLAISSPLVVAHTAYAALNCLAMCASYSSPFIRRNPHYKTAGILYKKLSSWQDDHGYQFCGHLLNLIQAEFSRVNGRETLAAQNFEAACLAACRLGNLRDKGLSYELAGRFFARDRRQELRATTNLDMAIQSYHAWGATALVHKLLDAYGDVLSRNPGVSELSRKLLLSYSPNNNLV